MLRYEHRQQRLLDRPSFWRRVLFHVVVGGVLIGGSLALGVLGYHITEGMSWIDALFNASMILTGMGPASAMQTVAGKLFASAFALYSGLVFLAAGGLLLAPFFHRLIHRFHLEGR